MLNVHVFYNQTDYALAETNFNMEMNELILLNGEGRLPESETALFNRFCSVRKSKSKSKASKFMVNLEKKSDFLKNEGGLVLISNLIQNPQKAYDIYAIKQHAQNGFKKFKRNLKLAPIHTASSERFTNKSIVAFAAMALNSYIRRVMRGTRLSALYSMGRALRKIASLSAFLDPDGKYRINPPTEEQIGILSKFRIKVPGSRAVKNFIQIVMR
jgi:hypothetical protein